MLRVSGSEFAGSFFVSNPSSAFSSRIQVCVFVVLVPLQELVLASSSQDSFSFCSGLYAPAVYSKLVQELALPCRVAYATGFVCSNGGVERSDFCLLF
jgi:hypothetical protein